MLLSLPVLDHDIPSVIDFSPAGDRHLRLILAMSRLGMIQDGDLADLRRTQVSASAIHNLIEKGWQRAIGADYDFTILSAHARLILPDLTEEEFKTEAGSTLIGLAINGTTPEWIAIGAVFLSIEDIHPGLGKKALRILESALWRFGTPHTPAGAFALCQELYWQGNDDEMMALEEYGEEADDVDIPRRSVMFDGTPEWAYFDGQITIQDTDFCALAATYANHPAGRVLAALVRLLSTNKNNELFAPAHDGYGWANEPPIVCGWQQENDFDVIFDENYRYYMEGGEEPPWIGCVKFEPTEEGIKKALPAIRHTAFSLSALDSALTEIKECSTQVQEAQTKTG